MGARSEPKQKANNVPARTATARESGTVTPVFSRGNQELTRLFRAARASASVLPVVPPTDPSEREADQAADAVMRMVDPSAAPVVVNRSESPTLRAKCAECEEELRRDATGDASATAPPVVHEALASPGRPLDSASRAFFEPRFGADFSAVRVHDGPAAAVSADAVQARAYAVGSDVVFAAGEYAPQTADGQRLLAHELAHVVQQRASESLGTIRRQVESGMANAVAPMSSPDSGPELTLTSTDPGKIEQLISALNQGNWDVDSLAAALTDAEMQGLAPDIRLRLIQVISGGYLVGDEDETTIVRLISTTPLGQAADVIKGLDAALLKQLESAVDGDEYKTYHARLGELYWHALTPQQAELVTRDAKIFPWAHPGLLEGARRGRVSYDPVKIDDQGKIIVSFYLVPPFLPMAAIKKGPFELEPQEVIGVYFLQPEEYVGKEAGKTTYMPAVNFLALYQNTFRQEMGFVGDVALLGLGGAGVAGATTKLGKVIAALELALATADVGIREYRREIAQTDVGQAFLRVWDRIQFLITIYGLARLASMVPGIFRSLRDAWRGWRSVATATGQEASLSRIERDVEDVLRRSDEAEVAHDSQQLGSTPSSPEQTALGPKIETPAEFEARGGESGKPPPQSNTNSDPTAIPSNDSQAGVTPGAAALKVPQGLTQPQFDAGGRLIRSKVAGISDDIVVQGSRAGGTAKPTSDIDFAVRVSPEKFDELIKARFGTPNPGSAKERTMQHAIETGKVQAGEAGLRPLRKELQDALGMEVDISIIRKGGPFDSPPTIPVP